MKKKNKLRFKKIVYIVLGVILLSSVFLDTYLLLKYDILPAKYLVIYGIFVVLIPVLMVLFTLFGKRKSKTKVAFAFIEIIYIFVLSIAFFYLNHTFNFIESFVKGYDYETKNYYVLINKNSNYNKIDNLNDKNIGYATGLDESIDHALEKLNKKINAKKIKLEGYNELFNNLDNGEIDGMLIISSYYDMLLETDKDEENTSPIGYDNKYVILYTFSIKEKIEQKSIDVDVTKKPFNIYISGMDSYGKITDKSRSDVNIVMSVNPKTHKILLINIPRDYYVELDSTGNKDKLTHAGIYGIDMSVKTLEKLLDTEINYYVKVNYNAIIKLVDALDGVDVESEFEFRTYELRHLIKKGTNHVNGKQALDFVRTRKAFNDGDRVRGENQQRMIQAVFKKATSPAIITKFDDILKSLDGSFTTNMSMKNITSLIKMQIKDMPSWEFESISLNGSDAYAITYSAPGQELYVMMPNEETVNTAIEKLHQYKE